MIRRRIGPVMLRANSSSAVRSIHWHPPSRCSILTPMSEKLLTLLAFAIIYFVWGSTFLAIRIGVREVPPLLFAAMRFMAAGLALYGWMILKGERSPSGRQWTSVAVLAT